MDKHSHTAIYTMMFGHCFSIAVVGSSFRWDCENPPGVFYGHLLAGAVGRQTKDCDHFYVRLK